MRGRIVATTNAAGEIRLSLRSQENARLVDNFSAARPLVSCAELHHFVNDKLPPPGPKTGHGFTPPDKRFTKLGSTTCREAAACIEERYGKQALFITGTIPGSASCISMVVASYSSYIMARVNQWFRNTVRDVHVVWVWEYQKRGVLHNHALVASGDRAGLERLRDRWHVFWVRLLRQVSRRANVDLFARRNGESWWYEPDVVRTEAAWVEKSVRSYLSKYLSKKASKGNNEAFYNPAAWWGISRNVRRLVEAARLRVESPSLNWEGICEQFESIGADLVASVATTFRVRNPVFACDVGLITFSAPSVARELFARVTDAVCRLTASLVDADVVRAVFFGDGWRKLVPLDTCDTLATRTTYKRRAGPKSG